MSKQWSPFDYLRGMRGKDLAVGVATIPIIIPLQIVVAALVGISRAIEAVLSRLLP